MSTFGVLTALSFQSHLLSFSLYSLSPPPHLLLWESRLVFWTKSNQLGLRRRKASSLEIGSAYKSMGLSTHMSHLHTLPQFHWAGSVCVSACTYWCTFFSKVDWEEMKEYVTQMLVWWHYCACDVWGRSLAETAGNSLTSVKRFPVSQTDLLSQETVWMSCGEGEGQMRSSLNLSEEPCKGVDVHLSLSIGYFIHLKGLKRLFL